MNIVVFIKQVPDTNDVKWTANNNIDRTQMESIMNPVDRQAVEAALRIKEKTNSIVTVVTMGPSKAQKVLEEAVAMGADEAFLLYDSLFAGSDTWATSTVLATAAKKKVPDCRLMIFGQTAIDGETGQTGIATAVKMNFPYVTHVNSIIDVNEESITVVSETEHEKNTYKISLPAAICVNNFEFRPRIPKINGYIKSKDYYYNIYNSIDLDLNSADTGIKGSPTRVSKVYRTDDKRHCKFITSENKIKELSDEIKGALE